MPTITFSFKDFQQLLGKKLTVPEFEDLLVLYAKAEVEKYDKASDEVTLKLDDTNLPYLWCPEGLARFFRGMLGISKGMQKFKAKSSGYKVTVEDSVKAVRPFITAFVAKGRKIDDYLLKQLIQIQEKFCESYGRRRQKTSIGLYAYGKISFPVHYRAVEPSSAKFVPLGFDHPMDLNQVLKMHPKGQQYAWILKGASKYPLLQDNKGEILSFPPIINSSTTGRLKTGDSELLFEATGTDEESVSLAASIFAHNLAERGFEIFSATISYKAKSETTPSGKTLKISITPEFIEKVTGLKLSAAEARQLLAKAGYECAGNQAIVPDYRADIMHSVDVAEDVAIAFGYDNIKDEPLKSYTIGMPLAAVQKVNNLRKAVVAMGFQEIFSHILTDKSSLIGSAEIIELENYMSETYSAVRNSLLPQLLDVLSRNKHTDYPQKVFEEGTVSARNGSKIMEWHSLALVSAHSKADFTEQKQHLSAILGSLGAQFAIKPTEHAAFIKGRAGSIIVDNETIGVIGEISPAVLSKFGIEMPATALELNLNLLFQQ
ncbi:phenylalanine--tRNA ligase subunit beta [Candidatus Woesearchaeota archaeon]|nr:phenylalanine--tRNA ligase subunit beta [Candidatus Woesearchaeota archaeon]